MGAFTGAARSGAFAALLAATVPVSAIAQGGTPSAAVVLTLACNVLGGGFTIKEPDGRTVENSDSAAFAPASPALSRIDAASRTVSVAGGDLPHPAGAPGPVFVGLGPARFRWGSAVYEVTPEAAGGFAIHSTSSSVIGTGPRAGKIIEAFFVGSCAAIPASDFH